VPREDSGRERLQCGGAAAAARPTQVFSKKNNFVFTKKLVFGMVIHLTLCCK
jgi:hypothetical protein